MRLCAYVMVLPLFTSGCIDPNFGKKTETTTAKSKASQSNVAANGNPTPKTATPNSQRSANHNGTFPPNQQTTPHPQTTTQPPPKQPAVRTPRHQTTNRAPVNAMPIHLSAGAALPQSLPGGTAMSFTAEYRFRGGRPKSGVRYVWVIQGRGGKTLRVGLPGLRSRGTLPAFFTRKLRPGDKPFRGFIEEWPASTGRRQPGDGKRVSNVVPLS